MNKPAKVYQKVPPHHPLISRVTQPVKGYISPLDLAHPGHADEWAMLTNAGQKSAGEPR